jgi:tryptophan-rich sensory protein
MNRGDWLGFVIAFLLCFAVAAIGGYITAPEIPHWYSGLKTSSLNPPGYVFGPVWTCLYAMMALAAGLIWRKRGSSRIAVPLVCFCVQLALNLGWSILFFGLHRIGSALTEILVLDVSIVITLAALWRVDRTAGLLLVPYLAWSLFASYLCWQVWALNPPPG